MRTSIHSSPFSRIAFVLLLILGLGCETDGPEFASGDTRVVSGMLEGETAQETDFFAITRSGTVNILLTQLEVVDEESGEPLESPLLGVGVGQPDPENQDACRLTFTQGLSEGGSFSVFFTDGLYCLVAFRPSTEPAATRIVYSVTMTGAFS